MALIEFPLNYMEHFKNRLVQKKFADPKTISGSTISIRMDETSKTRNKACDHFRGQGILNISS